MVSTNPFFVYSLHPRASAKQCNIFISIPSCRVYVLIYSIRCFSIASPNPLIIETLLTWLGIVIMAFCALLYWDQKKNQKVLVTTTRDKVFCETNLGTTEFPFWYLAHVASIAYPWLRLGSVSARACSSLLALAIPSCLGFVGSNRICLVISLLIIGSIRPESILAIRRTSLQQ
jgi:hypothetical protein